MDIALELLPKQHEFLTANNRLVIYRAGIRGGKTYVLSAWAVIRALQGRKIVLLEPTYGMCRDVLLPCLMDRLQAFGLVEGQHFVVNLSSLNIKFRNSKGEILIRSAESAETLRGITADDGGIDEFSQIKTDNAYKILIGRLSKSEDAQIRLTSSPSPVAWTRELETNSNCKVIHQTTLDNFYLPRSYIADMIDQYGEGSKWYRQEILGELVNLEDGVIDVSKLIQVPYHIPHGCAFVRAWDTASSSKTSADYTASCLMSLNNGIYTIHDVTRQKGAFSSLQASIVNNMRSDPPGTYQLVENTGAGQVIMSVLKALPELRGIHIQPVDAINDKISRALPLSGKIAGGGVHYCAATWNKDFLSEMEQFGAKCPHDDQVDAAAHAFNWLSKPKSSATNFNFI